MKRRTVLRATLGAGLVVASLWVMPNRAQAQSAVALWVSPVAGVGDFRGQYRVVPHELGVGSTVNLDANAVLGLQAEATLRDLPLRLRGGAARTVDGFLRIQTGYRTESCGETCTRTEVLYGSAGEAAVMLFWTDAVLAPFSRQLSPYVFVGATYRRTSYSPTMAEIATYFPGVEGKRMVRYGIGVEVMTWGRKVWLEYARHAADGWLVSDHSSINPPQRQQVLSIGVKFKVR